jgi:hypothetical protein
MSAVGVDQDSAAHSEDDDDGDDDGYASATQFEFLLEIGALVARRMIRKR